MITLKKVFFYVPSFVHAIEPPSFPLHPSNICLYDILAVVI